jgi:hypothetical protein
VQLGRLTVSLPCNVMSPMAACHRTARARGGLEPLPTPAPIRPHRPLRPSVSSHQRIFPCRRSSIIDGEDNGFSIYFSKIPSSPAALTSFPTSPCRYPSHPTAGAPLQLPPSPPALPDEHTRPLCGKMEQGRSALARRAVGEEPHRQERRHGRTAATVDAMAACAARVGRAAEASRPEPLGQAKAARPTSGPTCRPESARWPDRLFF